VNRNRRYAVATSSAGCDDAEDVRSATMIKVVRLVAGLTMCIAVELGNLCPTSATIRANVASPLTWFRSIGVLTCDFLMAGWRGAGPDLILWASGSGSGVFRPAGRGADPGSRCPKPRRTRPGVMTVVGCGGCQGSRWSLTRVRARRSWVRAATMGQVHRSACSGVRIFGVVQPRACFANRNVCSMSNRRIWARQTRSRSRPDGSSPCHHSHNVFGSRSRRPGGRDTLQPDQGCLDDAHLPARLAVGALGWVQPVPCLGSNVAVGVVLAVRSHVRGGPGAGIGAGEPGSAARPVGPAFEAPVGRSTCGRCGPGLRPAPSCR
jgi:hypothetical protein